MDNQSRAIAAGEEGCRYETLFCVFLVGLALLARENPGFLHPRVLPLSALLLGLNLAAGLSMRLWPARPAASAGIILGNCGVITAMLGASGGPESNLWVLYLLPIFTASLLLGGREAFWVTAGAIAFNAAYVWTAAGELGADIAFSLGVKTGVLALSGAVTAALVRSERRAADEARLRREALAAMEQRMRERQRSQEHARRLIETGLSASGAVHDARSPLTVILGSARLALEEPGLTADARDHLERILRSARLCESVLVTALRAEQTGTLRALPLDLRTIVDGVLRDQAAELARRGIALRWESEAELPLIPGEADQLGRVLRNLVGNARDAMEGGGELIVRAATVRDPRGAPISVRMTVEDTGPGIPPGRLESIFELFETGKTEGKGTGLGLYLARTIVQRHGGAIWAENRPGGGARFVIELPRTDGSRGPRPREDAARA